MADDGDIRSILQITDEACEEMLRAAVEAYSNGNLAQAETILVGLMALASDDPRPVKLLGSALMLQNQHVEAERIYERAYALDPDDPYVLVALGEIKLKALKLAEAIPFFERLFELDPDGQHPAANRGRKLIKSYHDKLASA